MKVIDWVKVLDKEILERPILPEKRITLDTGRHRISELDDDSIDSLKQEEEESIPSSKKHSLEDKKEEEAEIIIDEGRSDNSQDKRNKKIDTEMKELFEIMMQNEKFNLKEFEEENMRLYEQEYPGKFLFIL